MFLHLELFPAIRFMATYKLCNQCLSTLKFWVWILLIVRCNRYNNMWYSLSMTCDRSLVFSGYRTPVSAANKTDRHGITEILLKVALYTMTLNPQPTVHHHCHILYTTSILLLSGTSELTKKFNFNSIFINSYFCYWI